MPSQFSHHTIHYWFLLLQRLVTEDILLHAVWPETGSVFEFALMTKFGRALLAGVQSPISLDATGGVNSYGYPLIALVIKDDAGNGVPIAHLLYGNTKAPALVIERFLREVAHGAQVDFKGRIIFVDKDTAEMDGALALGMRVLLCWFHYKQEWQKFLKTAEAGVPDLKTRKAIQSNLSDIKRCTNIDHFVRAVAAFRTKWAAYPAVSVPSDDPHCYGSYTLIITPVSSLAYAGALSLETRVVQARELEAQR